MARTVNCVKLGREADGLDFPPMPGELGKKLFESVSKEAWAQWIRMQTMIINENRLNLADAAHRKSILPSRSRSTSSAPGPTRYRATCRRKPDPSRANDQPAGATGIRRAFFARSPACGCWLPYAYLSSQRSGVS